MDIEVRYLNENEIYKARELYEKVFSDSKEFVDYFFAKEIKSCNVLGGFFSDELVSMMFLNKKRLCFNDKIIEGSYIYAVATDEKYRNRGFMGMLMKRVIEDKKKDEFIYLIPVNDRIYERHGFELIRESYQHRIDESFNASGYSIEYNFDIMDLTRFAESVIEKGAVNVLLDRAYFERIIKMTECDGGRVCLIIDDDKTIHSIIVTGLKDDKECIINVISKKSSELFYANIFYNLRLLEKPISNVFFKHPIMSYNGEFKGKNINLNDEV